MSDTEEKNSKGKSAKRNAEQRGRKGDQRRKQKVDHVQAAKQQIDAMMAAIEAAPASAVVKEPVAAVMAPADTAAPQASERPTVQDPAPEPEQEIATLTAAAVDLAEVAPAPQESTGLAAALFAAAEIAPAPQEPQDITELTLVPATSTEVVPVVTAVPMTAPVNLQTIAAAYGDYTRKSFEQTRSFLDKLAAVRSLDQAVEVQAEFARQAFETFVAESQKIRELHSELARQKFERLEGFVAMTQGARSI